MPKNFYLDTNVFIARFKRDDPFFKEAKVIIQSVIRGEMKAETSVLTLAEVASVSGRLYLAGNRSDDARGRAFVIRMLRKLAELKPNFINIPGDKPIAIRGIDTFLPTIFDEAIVLSLKCKLRTPDLMHLAAARYAKMMNGELGAFVTADGGFLSDRKKLAEILGVPVLSPKDYVKAFGIG